MTQFIAVAEVNQGRESMGLIYFGNKLSYFAQMKFLKRSFELTESGVGLAVFRISYFFVLFFEVLQMYNQRQLLDSPAPWISDGAISLGPVLLVWLASIILLIVGLFTREALIINWLAGLLTFGTSSTMHYHMDYVYAGLGFALLWIPISARLSLDSFRQRTRSVQKVAKIHYDAIVIICIGLVYIDSIFWKFNGTHWSSGLGMWSPVNQIGFTRWDLSFLENFDSLLFFAGYLTFAFEGLFFLFLLNNSLRWVAFVIGLGLHIGIALCFPIPLFGWAYIGIYFLILPPTFWENALTRFKHATKRLSLESSNYQKKFLDFLSDSTPQISPYFVSTRTRMISWITLIVLCCIIQASMICTAPTMRIGHFLPGPVVSASRTFLGLHQHGVFTEGHLRRSKRVVLLEWKFGGQKRTFPKNFQEGFYSDPRLFGRFWVNWQFRVAIEDPEIEDGKFRIGILNYLHFLSKSGELRFGKTVVTIYFKETEAAIAYRKGFLQDGKNRPFVPAYEIRWENKKPIFVKLPETASGG